MLRNIILTVAAVVGAAVIVKNIAEETGYDENSIVLEAEILPEQKCDSEGQAVNSSEAKKIYRSVVFHARLAYDLALKVIVKTSKAIVSKFNKVIDISAQIVAKTLAPFGTFFTKNQDAAAALITFVIPLITVYLKEHNQRVKYYDPWINKWWYAYSTPTREQTARYKYYRSMRDPITNMLIHGVKESLDYAKIAVY